MGQIRILTKDMPSSVKGFCVKCFDDCDYFTIFVNSCLNDRVKWETIEHELEHIKNNDFSSIETINQIETERHGE